MLSPQDSIGESIMFVRPSVRPFVRTDIVTTISHERLEQSRWNLRGITSRFEGQRSKVKVKVIASRRGSEGINVDGGLSTSMNFAEKNDWR